MQVASLNGSQENNIIDIKLHFQIHAPWFSLYWSCHTIPLYNATICSPVRKCTLYTYATCICFPELNIHAALKRCILHTLLYKLTYYITFIIKIPFKDCNYHNFWWCWDKPSSIVGNSTVKLCLWFEQKELPIIEDGFSVHHHKILWMVILT